MPAFVPAGSSVKGPVVAVHGIDRELPLWALLAARPGGFVVVVVGGYPFQQIEQLGSQEQRHPAS